MVDGLYFGRVQRPLKRAGHSCCKPNNECAHDGQAVTHCFEAEDGTLWTGASNYLSNVDFCPFCGFEAKRTARLRISDDAVKGNRPDEI